MDAGRDSNGLRQFETRFRTLPQEIRISCGSFSSSELSQPMRHICSGLREAFRTLRCLPMNGHPQAFGNSSPEYAAD